MLLENAGKVIITRDGAEILSSLQLDDPIIKFALSYICQYAKQRGDGSKMGVILLHKIISELASKSSSAEKMNYSDSYIIGLQTARKSKAIQFIRHLRLKIIPVLRKTVLSQYCFLTKTCGSSFQQIVSSFLLTNLSSQFPKVIALKLLSLLTEFIGEPDGRISFENVMKSLENYTNMIFQVYKVPLRMSQVIDGFILSRDFKVLPKQGNIRNRNVVLWSIPLEQNVDEMTTIPTIETSDESTFMKTVIYKNMLLTEAIQSMEKHNIRMIISSVYFPEWAVSTCSKYSIGVVDMVGEEEFNFLVEKLKVSPITCRADLKDLKNVCKVEVEAMHLGTSRYAFLQIKTRQIVIAGPTVSQCNQYSKALLRCLRTLRSWIHDSREMDCFNVSGNFSYQPHVRDTEDALFWCPSNGYIEYVSYLVINEQPELVSPLLLDEQNIDILNSVLLEIPQILHRSAIGKRNGGFLQRLLHFKSELRNENFKLMLEENYDARGIENPFQFFHCLQNALLASESMLKISSVIYTNNSTEDAVPSLK